MSDRALLRHTLATLAYRGGKAIRGGAPAADFRAGAGTRTPLEILAHIGDLLDWSLSIAEGGHVWREAEPGDWKSASARFFDGLRRLDDRIAAPEPLGCAQEALFQGPIADALTHVGQIALLRRLAGSPLRGENYYKADIASGRVGPEQSAPRKEFE